MQNTFSWSSWSLLAFSHTMSTFCRSTDASIYWRQSCSSRESLKFKASLYTSIISSTSCTWPEITRDKMPFHNSREFTKQKEWPFSKHFFCINLSIQNSRTGSDWWSIFTEKKIPLLLRLNQELALKKEMSGLTKWRHETATPKDFLEKDFVTVGSTIFQDPRKKKSLNTLTSS